MLLPFVAAWPGAALRAADEPAVASTLLTPPDDAAQGDANKLIRELMGKEIDAAKTPIAKHEMAKKLLQQGIDSKADPAGQFVLYRMAREFAVGVGDPAVALQSIDETERAFHIDAASLRQETLAALAKTATNPLQSRELADAASTALDEAIAADNFEVAKLLAAQGLAAAKRAKDADVLRQWTGRGKEIEEIESAYDDAQPSIVKLAQKPLDPAANLAVGRYRVFIQGKWDMGLPMIAIGKDSPLQALAIVEMSPPAEPEAQLKLADGWWDLADTTADAAEKQRLQGRAMYWYGKSLPNLSGLPKEKVEKRLQEVTRDIFKKVQSAVRSNKMFYSYEPIRSNRGAIFADRLDEGGLLIGFEIAVGSTNDGEQYIRAIRPLFSTARGDNQGSMHGNARGDVITVRAQQGFAVGGLNIKAANRIEGLSVTFMQIQGAGLDPRSAYTSDWYGSRTGGANVRLGGSGNPMIGIVGRADNSLQEVALVQTK